MFYAFTVYDIFYKTIFFFNLKNKDVEGVAQAPNIAAIK